MKYVYENMDYEKRGLTDNILLRVIADDYGLVKERSRKYMGAAFSWKAAEMTSQMDACPVTGREEMQKILRIMRAYDPNYRARATQTGTAVSQQAITDVTLSRALPAGEYTATIQISTLSLDGETPLNGANVETVLVAK